MNRGAWQATAHGITKSETWLRTNTHTPQMELFGGVNICWRINILIWWSCFISQNNQKRTALYFPQWVASPAVASAWLMPLAFFLVIKSLLCLNPASPGCPGSSLFWLWWVASLHHQFFLLSWIIPNSRHADWLPHQNIVLLWLVSSHSCHQVNLLTFIAKLLTRVAQITVPTVSLSNSNKLVSSMLRSQWSRSPTTTILSNLMDTCSLHLAWPVGGIWYLAYFLLEVSHLVSMRLPSRPPALLTPFSMVFLFVVYNSSLFVMSKCWFILDWAFDFLLCLQLLPR